MSGIEGPEPPSRTVLRPDAWAKREAELRAEPPDDHAPFRALLEAATEHREAAQGLGAAYQALPLRDRRALLDAVLHDASAGQLDLLPLLAPLCEREPDPELRERMLTLLAKNGVQPAASETRMLLCGGPQAGAALLVRTWAHESDKLELLELCWRREQGTLHVATRACGARELPDIEAQLMARAGALGAPSELEPSPLQLGAEVLAQVLWHHLRVTGALPNALEAFADIIGPHAVAGP